jgi:rare lipoprotein A
MKHWIITLFGCLCAIWFSSLKAQTAEGYACIYSKQLCGNRTANGERLNCDALTAAHRHYKFGTKIRVTNLENKNSVIVRITDRGPFTRRFIIDLSPAAAKAIGLSYGKGKVRVHLEPITE